MTFEVKEFSVRGQQLHRFSARNLPDFIGHITGLLMQFLSLAPNRHVEVLIRVKDGAMGDSTES